VLISLQKISNSPLTRYVQVGEAGFRAGLGAEGAIERRGGFYGGACRGGWVSLRGPKVGGGIDPSPIPAAHPA
jgi:hypothetical protein